METLGNLIRAARKEKKLTQKELAELKGCYPADISGWETGDTTPQLNSIRKLASSLSKPIGYFLEQNKATSEAVNEDPHEYGSSAQNLHQKTLESGIPNSVVSGDSETLSPEDIEMRDELIRELRDSRDEWKARALKAERKLEQIETNQNSKTG